MTFSFGKLHASRSYWTVLALFAAANLWSWVAYRLREPECCEQLVAVGFPFPFYVSGGIGGRGDVLVTGLLLDLAIAWTLAVIAAWIGLSWRGRRSQEDGER